MTLDRAATVGSVVVAHCLMTASSRTATVSDDSASGQTWTDLGTMPQSVGTGLRRYVWYTTADETFLNVTFTISGGSVSAVNGHVIELGGVTAPPHLTSQNTYENQLDPLDVTGITTSAADTYLLGVMGKDSASEAWSTNPTGWTSVGTSLNRIFACTRNASTAGSYGCTVEWSSGSDRDVAALFAAFAVSGGGGGATRRTSSAVI